MLRSTTVCGLWMRSCDQPCLLYKLAADLQPDNRTDERLGLESSVENEANYLRFFAVATQHRSRWFATLCWMDCEKGVWKSSGRQSSNNELAQVLNVHLAKRDR